MKDYTFEMRQVFTETTADKPLITKEKGDGLEQEMSFVFETPEKHTWREGQDGIIIVLSKV